MKQKFIFYIIAICIPFLSLALLEGGLRLFKYGHEYPLFIKSTAFEGYLQPNPNVIKRFFHQAELAPNVSPDTFLFQETKLATTKRIVVMGGSTAAGFPFGRFGSPTGMLHQRIKQHYPTEDIELISVAMASINSYALVDFVDEVIQIKPDAVLIYAGHNEYLGVMGVGSNYASKGGHAANLVFLSLKNLRIFQVFQDGLYALSSLLMLDTKDSLNHQNSSRTVMATVAKEKSIVYGSELFEAGISQFKNNLRMILTTFTANDIPVFLSSIASNEKDHIPFESTDSPQTLQLLAKIKALSAQIEVAQAQLIQSGDPLSANLAFAIATRLQAGQSQYAKNFFQDARDFDELRFRAPSEFNHVIKTLSAEFSQVVLVDAEAQIRDDSVDQLIGKKHMLEHLHPTSRGYFLIAQAFFQALQANAFFDTDKVIVHQQDAWKNQTNLDVDDIIAAQKVGLLTSDYPFKKDEAAVVFALNDSSTDMVSALNNDIQITNIAYQRLKTGNWIDTQSRLASVLQQQQKWREAAIALGSLYDAIPNNIDAARGASLLYLRINELSLAHYYALRAYRSRPEDANFGLSLAEILFKSGNKAGAISMLDEVISKHPDMQKALSIKQMINQ